MSELKINLQQCGAGPLDPRMSDSRLRDHFAGLAMQEICRLNNGDNPDSGSQQAYVWADAMLKARGK